MTPYMVKEQKLWAWKVNGPTGFVSAHLTKEAAVEAADALNAAHLEGEFHRDKVISRARARKAKP